MEHFVVAFHGRSITEMGADRYWEIHVHASDPETAMARVHAHVANWLVFERSYYFLDPKSYRLCPPGSIAYREIPSE